MRLKRFLIPSLAAVGLLPQHAAAIPTDDLTPPETGKASLFQTFKLQHVYLLAGHRSHSSHASHSSHRSSSGGTVYRAPVYTAPKAPVTPLYTPPASDSTAPSTILPSSPDAALKVLPGNSDKFLEIAKQVQLALYSWGYYTGEIDGVVGPATRAAISSMQADWNLKVTGTITPEVLDALKIVAE
ncbi:MAG: His-Xaa-Ser repeat protein HxsA [Devosia sp.]|uniref:His-Xaa-Ser repeat protein HxsA n=1 Tax=Devosia sp. TaxID=1871048 RepID=UPI001A3C58A0|nr:His-Xaa-Ser repeat protein HxsA [Devosia sp.]MBL8597783.1 His-Xaa-Ser repeat protein HxsA [Devosia sp.]